MTPIIQFGGAMIHSKLLLLILVLSAALGISVKTEEARLRRQRARTTAIALQLANADAARDSTRNVALENGTVARILGDSLRLVEKRVVQISQKSDALDAAMHRERIASYTLSATINSLRQSVTAANTIATRGDRRTARFDVRQEPFTVNADIVMAPLPDSATLSLRIRVDPLNVQGRVTCSAADRDGVRIANVSTASPPWAEVRFGQLEQAPEVCNSDLGRRASRRSRFIQLAPVVIAAGRVVLPRARRPWAILFGSGIVIRL
jgi:hypothetical protein